MPLHPDLVKRVLHVVELERLDDRFDLLHRPPDKAAQSPPHLEAKAAPMKAIILSAGQGSRLGHLVDDRPKCLIEFNGRSLLDRQLDTLEANGVREAVVVTGFHDDQVRSGARGAERRAGGPDDLQPLLQGRRQYRARSTWRARRSPATAWCGTATRWSRTG